jgi:magnesium chelatase accessory protein
MGDRLEWATDGRDWPNRVASHFVRAAGFVWHVQLMGSGPPLLLVHGTGASTHSWRDLAPILARDFSIVAPDLPGHGFTDTPPAAQMSLPGMGLALGELLRTLGIRPVLAAGHSAGAAILARMCINGLIAPAALIALNGALVSLRGVPDQVFSPLAKLFAALPLVPRLFAWRAADTAVVARLLEQTGSTLDATGVALYARLMRSPAHVAGALAMMANWDLHSLERDLPRLTTPLFLVVGSNDQTVPPGDALRVRALVPGARIESLPGLGHLAHEERPAETADSIGRIAGAVGLS